MENKDIFYNAILGLQKYSTSTCRLLDTFLKLENNNQITASIEYLIKTTSLTKPTIYSSIKILKKDGVIIKDKDFRNTYTFDQARIYEIILQYKKQISLIKTKN